MEKCNQRKNEQLGMNAATAANKLRKLIMFKLLKDSNKNVCYRCGKTIDSVEELSIEHKIPWLHSDNPKELFFDIDNIAFSHLKCNLAASRKDIKHDDTYAEKALYGGFSNSSITSQDVLNIRELSKSMKGIDIAKLYNVNKHVIYRILSGKSFKYIK